MRKPHRSMKTILVVKTSSLGDVVHQMPAMTDARANRPELRLLWVVEVAFAPLARLHRGTADVIAVATRRWRSQLFSSATWEEVGDFRMRLRDVAPEMVIDTQGLIRSIPRIDKDAGKRARLEAISGVVPGLINPPPGCRFAPRCKFATPGCTAAVPELRTVETGHKVACVLY